MLPVMDNGDKAEDDRRGVKRKMALSSCDVCDTEEAKYRCPNCMKHTCSLACVKQHKMASGCCGVRDKAAFVPLSEFDEINLLSDYRFLEDTARLTQQSNRDAVIVRSNRHPKEGMWMIRKARTVKVTLKLLPKVFSKHRENRTIFKRAERRFYWQLKIHFPLSDAVYSERCPDNREIFQILNDYIHPSESDPVKRQKLKVYVHSPQEDIRVFLKSEQTQPNSLRYLELDLKKTLQENLMHKTIVEYPEIFVVLKEHSQEYLTRRPERSSAAQGIASANVTRTSCSPAKAQSEARSEALVHVAKKPKLSEDDELEEGELRSEDDDESTEDDDAVSDDTEKKIPAVHHDHDEDEDDDSDDTDEEELQGNENLKVEMKNCPPHNSLQDTQVDDGNQNKVDSVNITSKTEEMMVSQDPEEVHNTKTVTDDSRNQCEDNKLDVSPHECQENISSHAGLPEDGGVQDKTGDSEKNDDDVKELQGKENLEMEMKDCPSHNSLQDAQVDDGNQNKVIPVNINSKTEEIMVSQDAEVAHDTETFTNDGRIQCEDNKMDISPHECQENISSHAGLPEDGGVQDKTGDSEKNDDDDKEELQGNENLEMEMKDCPSHNSLQDAQVDDGNQNKVDSVNINSKTEEIMVSQDPEEAHNTETFTDDGRIQCEDNKMDVSPHECQENINSHAGLPEDGGVQDKTGDSEKNDDDDKEKLQGNENLNVEMKNCPSYNSLQDAQVDDGNQNKVDSVNINSKTEEIMVSQDPEEAHNTETFTNDGRIQCEDNKIDVSPQECQKKINSHAGRPEDDGVQDKTGDNEKNDDDNEEELQGNDNLNVEMKNCPHNSVQDSQVDDGNQNKVIPVNINSKTEEIMVSQDAEVAHNTETFTNDGRIQCEDNKMDISPHECQENINSHAGLPEDGGVQDKTGDSEKNDDDDKEELQGNENLSVEMKNCPSHNSLQDAQVDDGNQNKVDSVNINSKTEEMMVSQDPEEAHNTETFTDDGRIQSEDNKMDVSPHECQENINSHAGLPEDGGVQDKTGDSQKNDDDDKEELQGNENLNVEIKNCPSHNSLQDAQVDDGNQNKMDVVNITSKTEEIMTVSQDPKKAHNTETCIDGGRIQCKDNKIDGSLPECQEIINSDAGLPEDDGVQDKTGDSKKNDDDDEEKLQRKDNLDVEMKDCPPHKSVQDSQVDDGNQNKEIPVNITSKTEETMMVSLDAQEAHNTFINDGRSQCEDNKMDVFSPQECQKKINSHAGRPEDGGVQDKTGDSKKNDDDDKEEFQGNENLEVEMKNCPPHNSLQDAQVDGGNQNKVIPESNNSKTEETIKVFQDPEAETFTDGRSQCEDVKMDVLPQECPENVNSHAQLPEDDGVQDKTGDSEKNDGDNEEELQGNENIEMEMKDCPPHNSVQDSQVDD